MGTVQTVKAEQSLQSLKKLSGPEAKVLRDGSAVQIPARELVIGDVILLEAGDMIPADGRLIDVLLHIEHLQIFLPDSASKP